LKITKTRSEHAKQQRCQIADERRDKNGRETERQREREREREREMEMEG